MTHRDTELLPAVTDHCPAGQGRHCALVLAPETDEYVPVRQLLHSLSPNAAHVPALQATQAVDDTDPAIEANVPSGQIRHVAPKADPTDEDHVPTSQTVHCALEVNPFCDDHVPARQPAHRDVEDAPREEDQVPALHETHASAFNAAAMTEDHVPASH